MLRFPLLKSLYRTTDCSGNGQPCLLLILADLSPTQGGSARQWYKVETGQFSFGDIILWFALSLHTCKKGALHNFADLPIDSRRKENAKGAGYSAIYNGTPQHLPSYTTQRFMAEELCDVS
jgi:hypothetical protein